MVSEHRYYAMTDFRKEFFRIKITRCISVPGDCFRNCYTVRCAATFTTTAAFQNCNQQ